jgi:hypothetical protein
LVIVLEVRDTPTVEAQGKRCPQIMAAGLRLDKTRAEGGPVVAPEGRPVVVVDRDPSGRDRCGESLRP